MAGAPVGGERRRCGKPGRPATARPTAPCAIVPPTCLALLLLASCAPATRATPARAPTGKAAGDRTTSAGTPHDVESAPDAVDEIARAIYDRYRRFPGFRARFMQKWFGYPRHPAEPQRGTLFYRHPGRYSFRFDSGDQVVSNGERVVHYDAARLQASARDAHSDLHSAAFAFMYGPLTAGFRLRLATGYRFSGHVIEAKPRGPASAYQDILLFVRRENLVIDHVVIMAPEKNALVLVLEDLENEASVKHDEFDFKAPVGTTWIE